MTSYDQDLAVWAEETSRALRERRLDEIDWEHVAEEILDLGNEQEHALESRLMQILLHLLKMRYQPEKHGRSWDLSVIEQRSRLNKLFRRNPSLVGRVGEFMDDAYEIARLRAARQTGLALEVFPEKCGFTEAEVFGLR